MMKSIIITCLTVVCALTSVAQEANYATPDSVRPSSMSGKTLAAANVVNDVNSDGLVDALDVVHIVKYVKGQTLAGFKVGNADINKDGNVDFNDATLLSKLVTGIEMPAGDDPDPKDDPVDPDPGVIIIRGGDAVDPLPPTK